MGIRVTIDGEEQTYTAQALHDTRWNGWLCPSFSKDEAMKIATYLNNWADAHPDHQAYRMVWDDEQQAFIMTDSAYPDEPETIPLDCFGGYSVGAWSWIWDYATEQKYTAPMGIVDMGIRGDVGTEIMMEQTPILPCKCGKTPEHFPLAVNPFASPEQNEEYGGAHNPAPYPHYARIACDCGLEITVRGGGNYDSEWDVIQGWNFLYGKAIQPKAE